MMNEPEVSVIMAAYNSAGYIEESILSALNQTFQNFELIIIDDHSADNTLEIVEKYLNKDSRIRLIKNNTNLGPAVSRNIAIKGVRGKYIAVLDHDDIALPNRLQAQYDYMEAHPDIALVYCGAEIIDEKGKITGRRIPSDDFIELKFKLLTQDPIIHPSTFYRKTAMDEIGGYNDNYRYAEDWIFYSEIIKKYRIGYVPEILFKYRHTPRSITSGSESRKKQLNDGAHTSFVNLSNYIHISNDKARLLWDTLHNRSIKIVYNKNLSIGDLLESLKIYKSLANSFIIKEKLDKADSKKIWNIYSFERKSLFKQYFKSKFPNLSNKIKSFKTLLK